MKKFVLAFLVSFFAVAALAFAEEKGEAEENHNFHLSVFLGGATNLESESTGTALGADFELRMPFADRLFGTGVFAEKTFEENADATLLGALLFAHLYEGAKVYLGIAKESKTETEASEKTESEASDNLLIRIGAGYDFHLGKFSIGPVVNADFVDGETILVYGLAFGIGF